MIKRESQTNSNESLKVLISSKGKYDHMIILYQKIDFFKAEGSYTKIFLEDGNEILISKSLASIERKLNSLNFIRCHNSYLINIRKVTFFNSKKKILKINNSTIPISRRKYHSTIQIINILVNQI